MPTNLILSRRHFCQVTFPLGVWVHQILACWGTLYPYKRNPCFYCKSKTFTSTLSPLGTVSLPEDVGSNYIIHLCTRLPCRADPTIMFICSLLCHSAVKNTSVQKKDIHMDLGAKMMHTLGGHQIEKSDTLPFLKALWVACSDLEENFFRAQAQCESQRWQLLGLKFLMPYYAIFPSRWQGTCVFVFLIP